MPDSLKRHGAAYLLEAAGIAFFIVVSSVASTILKYPGSPLHELIPVKAWRRVPLAVVMGLVIVVVTRLTGPRSGAHINPAVTWAFYRHGKIGAPARSVGSAVAAGASPGLWLYVVAPTLAMLSAVEVYVRLGVAAQIPGHTPGPPYPVAPVPDRPSPKPP